MELIGGKKDTKKKSTKKTEKKTTTKKTTTKKTTTKKTTKKENPWLIHVKKIVKENPNKKFKEILIIAKKSYGKK